MFTENQVFRTTTLLTLVLSAGSATWRLPVGLGLLLGGLTSILAFRLMIIDGTNLLRKSKEGLIDRKQASQYSFRSFLKRCLLYAVALSIGTLSAYLSFLAVLAGLLLPRLAILYHLVRGRTKRGT